MMIWGAAFLEGSGHALFIFQGVGETCVES